MNKGCKTCAKEHRCEDKPILPMGPAFTFTMPRMKCLKWVPPGVLVPIDEVRL